MTKGQKSVLGKYWLCNQYDENFITKLMHTYHISDVLAKILSKRVNSISQAKTFLEPKIKTLLPDPFHLKDMNKAVNRVITAIKKKENIFIFADYDVDGATSAALIKNILRDIGQEATIYVPDRIKEGYGPSLAAMDKIKAAGASLLITVDCGSLAFEALERAAKLGVEVIIIDHHLSLESMPIATAFINPNRFDQVSDYKNLAAVGVSFLFLVGLIKTLKEEGYFCDNHLDSPNLLNQLDLVALGTVCDVVQLTGLNRAFVTQGLKVANARKNLGYNSLCDIADLQQEINCYHLGFILGPRINAGGRVGTSSLGATLLSSNCANTAKVIAQQLEEHNKQRRAIELHTLDEAMEKATIQKDNAFILITGQNWHPGVIGIIASRIKEKYNKPTAIIAINDQMGIASCRSVKGIDFGSKIIEAKQNNLLISGGGHAMAAGFKILPQKITALHQFLLSKFTESLKVSKDHLTENYALELTSLGANLELIAEINKLEPFGAGNFEPLICFSNLYVLRANIVGDKHIKILFAPKKDSYGRKPLNSIAFNALDTPLSDIILSQKAHNLSAIGVLRVNNWQNINTPQLILKDLIIEDKI